MRRRHYRTPSEQIPVPIPAALYVRATRVFLRSPGQWQSETNVLRQAAEIGMRFVTRDAVLERARDRWQRGAGAKKRVLGVWQNTYEHARTCDEAGGSITLRVACAIDKGLVLLGA